MERWRDGEMEGWRDGEMERWRDGGMDGSYRTHQSSIQLTNHQVPHNQSYSIHSNSTFAAIVQCVYKTQLLL